MSVFSRTKKQHSETTYPTKRQQVFSPISEQQNRFAGGWPHCVTPTTIPSVFIRHVVNHKIGTHAGGAGPRDFLFDESGNGER
ncbi:hypothetical protein [Escherichia coli]|uniref:hypothetical protein n=1 Tax=Escherichia coli TaxID=562 RepID=UPI002AC4D2D6|nr:hypothetical protein [Escherichia coli]MDZ4899033.1 hypothetical protein [Escherichia coli]